MKKYQLKKIIKETIKELREDIDPGPHNSHRRLVGTVCDSNTGLPVVGPNNIITITQNTGTQCNGQICQPGDAGKTYTGTFGPNLTPFLAGHEYELLWFDMPVNKNVFINLTYQNDMCQGTCDTFNNWPLGDTQGYNEFMQQYGATIAGGTPVNSQWSLGGASTYYPSQSSFCEWCEWSNDPVWTTPDTSPIGTSN